MIVSMHKFNILALYKLKIFSLFVLSALFLVSCGGGGGSSGGGTSSSVDYSVSFYDENLDFIDTMLVSDIQSGTWYKAGENTPATNHDLADDIRLYAAKNVTEINTQEQLANITTDETTLAGNYILLESIDLVVDGESFDGVEGWKPIGIGIGSFKGIFNGNFNRITNLWINKTSSSHIGFFGSISGAKIRNLGVEIAEGNEIRGGDDVGGIVGYGDTSNITNSYFIGNVNGDTNIGGIVGYGNTSNIINSYFEGNISGDTYIGGIAGYDDNGYIYSSHSNANIIATRYVGGIAGYGLGGNITNSYSTGNIISAYIAGGIVGYGDNSIAITNSYSTGNISGNDGIGGIAGAIDGGSIANSYSVVNINGYASAGGIVGVIDNGLIANSYSMGNISGYDTIGGIAGYADDATVQNNAAINPSITGVAYTNRIIGDFVNREPSNNFARSALDSGFTDTDDEHSGIDKDDSEFWSKDTYTRDLHWVFAGDDADPWAWGIFDDYPYPTLYWQTQRP